MKLWIVIVVINLSFSVADKYIKFYKIGFVGNSQLVANGSSKLTVPMQETVSW